MTRKDDVNSEISTREKLSLHSYQISELQETADMLRNNMIKNVETLTSHAYIIQDTAKKNQELEKKMKDHDDMLNAHSIDYLNKRSIVDLFNDLLNSPKKMAQVCLLLVILETTSGVIGMFLKKFLGM